MERFPKFNRDLLFMVRYDLSRPPNNLIESLIKKNLLPLLFDSHPEARGRIVGAEWWVHTRAAGRNLGQRVSVFVWSITQLF